jgi:ribonucleoside-triphosphate reductase
MERDTCSKCGAEIVDGCSVPGCKAPVEVYSRVVGYLRPIATWNEGKQAEFLDRKEYELRNGDHNGGSAEE